MKTTVTRMVRLYRIPIIGLIAKQINVLLGADIPRCATIGTNVSFPHNSVGTVIHKNTVIEDDVQIYQNVTIGRSDVYKNDEGYDPECIKFHIGKGACVCAGAKIICAKGTLCIGNYSVIAANAVLLNSTGSGEIWAGVPAKLIGYRDDITD